MSQTIQEAIETLQMFRAFREKTHPNTEANKALDTLLAHYTKQVPEDVKEMIREAADSVVIDVRNETDSVSEGYRAKHQFMKGAELAASYYEQRLAEKDALIDGLTKALSDKQDSLDLCKEQVKELRIEMREMNRR